MPKNPKGNIEKLERSENAWKTLAPTKEYGGMTQAQFSELVNASRNARTLINDLENQKTEAKAARDASDEIALAKLKLVKNGVLSDPTEGENSAIYEALGYVRKDNKKSGLTRKKKDGDDPTS